MPEQNLTREPLFQHLMRDHAVLILIARLLIDAKQVEEVLWIPFSNVLGSVTRKNEAPGDFVQPVLLVVVAHLVDSEALLLSIADKIIGAKGFGTHATEQSPSSGAKRFGS